MLDRSCQVQRHTHAERGKDCYETPVCAVVALMRVEQLPERVWEPAVGRGAIAEVLEMFGHDVIVSDIQDYGYPDTIEADFFSFDTALFADTIVTNPPFMHANNFVAHALKLCPRVIMLLRLAFLESERRSPILDNAGLENVYVFRRRLPFMHRDNWQGRKTNSGMAFAWFSWRRGYVGKAHIERISWDDR